MSDCRLTAVLATLYTTMSADQIFNSHNTWHNLLADSISSRMAHDLPADWYLKKISMGVSNLQLASKSRVKFIIKA